MSSRFTAKEATNLEFWRELNPQLSVEKTADAPRPAMPDPDLLFAQIRHEGYVNEPGVLPAEWIERLRTGVGRLHERGIPPVFAFIYDEAWLTFRSLAPFLGRVLGDDYRVLPAFWAWYVAPSESSAGWAPHCDRSNSELRADNSPDSLTVWLPLTEATPLNGCMYVYPFHLDNRPSGGAVLEGVQLQHIRALPATPGSLLAWHQRLLHWGGRASQLATTPRCSLALEFQRGDLAPFESPLIEPGAIPSFSARLGLIGKLMCKYESFQRIDSPELRALAVALNWKFGPKN